MPRFKVLHIITRLDKGGAPKNTLLTVSGSDKEHLEVTLVSGPSYDPEEDLEARTSESGVEFLVFEDLIRPIRPWQDLKATWKLWRFIRERKFHIVHTHTSKAGVVGRLAAILARTPVIIHASHGHIFTGFFNPFYSRILLLVDKLLSLFTDRIVTLTQKGLEEQVELGLAPRKKFVVIPSGVNLHRFMNARVDAAAKRAELGLPPEGPIIGVVAELDPRKGHRYLIEAMPHVIKGHPDARLLIIGQGPLKAELEAQTRGLGLEKAICFTGHREDVPELLNLMDVFVLPSINEGMGRVLVEAMACGRPVVASNLMGIPELVDDERTGCLVRPRHPDDLAAGINRLLDHPDQAREMGRRGREKVYPAYDESVMIQAYNHLYLEVLAEKGLA